MELTVGLYLLLHKCHVMYGDSFFYGKDLMSQPLVKQTRMAGLNLLTLYDVPVSVPRIHRGTCINMVNCNTFDVFLL